MGTLIESDKEAFKRMGRVYIDELISLPFMQKDSSELAPLYDALSIQFLALAHFFAIVKESEEDDLIGRIKAPLALRSFIETIANINYMILNKEDHALINAYLSEAEHAVDDLYNSFRGTQIRSRRNQWCTLSISRRIRILQETAGSQPNLPLLYSYLSSFVHASPSHLNTSHIDYEKLYSLYYNGILLLLISLDRILHDGDVIKKSLTISSLAKIKLDQEKQKKQPSKKSIETFETIISHMQ